MLSLKVSQRFITCCTTRLELPKILRRVALQALAILVPCNRASYSASLFDAYGKLIRNIYFSLSPCGHISITPTPAHSTLLDPSKYIVHTLDKSGGPVFCNSRHSAVKSGKICDFMPFLFSYVISRGRFRFPTRRCALLLLDYSICLTRVPRSTL
jgi:hypothetical protein